MAIDQKKYIDIVSGVGGAASVSRRDLMGRVMTTNELAEVGTTYELSLSGVGTLFGTDSEEYAYASKYFSFISKSVTQASKLSFTRWYPEGTNTALYGSSSGVETNISVWQALFRPWFSVEIDGSADPITIHAYSNDYPFAESPTLYDVATKINSELSGTGISVVWDGSKFIVTSLSGSEGTLSFVTDYDDGSIGATDDYIGALMGCEATSEGAYIVQGLALETPVAAITRVSELSDNFGSFMFLDALTNAEIDLVAAWVTAGNYKFLYSVPVLAANASTLTALLGGATGTILTLTDALTDYAEYMPMVLLATTDYDKVNSTKNFMFQKFDSDTPTVTTDALSDSYDALYVNYLGTTQQAGKLIAFYQRGKMMDGADVAPYCNEIWLKDAFATAYMNLLLALEKIPANTTGINIARTNMQSIIDEAIFNGTILPGKTLTTTQKSYIDQVTGTADSWRDIEKIGYWLGVVIEEDQGEYTLDYTLVYSKGDSIRKVTGTDILI